MLGLQNKAVNEAIKILQQSFEVKAPTTLEDYFDVQVIKSKNGEQTWLGQPPIIKSLEKMLDEDVKTLQSTLTPDSPGFVGQKVVEDEDKVNEKEQALYRSGVGTLFVENPNTRLILISCSQGILCSSSLSCYLLLRLLVYMYLSQLMRTFTNYL